MDAQIEAGHRPRRVLIVDDNDALAETIAWLAEQQGYATQVCFDGPSAIERVKSFQPDIVLLDIGLPGMSGLETCRAIRQMPGADAVFIIAQTGWAHEEMRWKVKEAGFDLHLVKPVSFEALRQALELPSIKPPGTG